MAQSDHYDLSPAENPSADIREMDASDYRERNILVSVRCPFLFLQLARRRSLIWPGSRTSKTTDNHI
jgi:hypothetical protein